MILQPEKSVVAPSVCNPRNQSFFPSNLSCRDSSSEIIAQRFARPPAGQHHEGNYCRCCFRGCGRCAGERLRASDRGEASPVQHRVRVIAAVNTRSILVLT